MQNNFTKKQKILIVLFCLPMLYALLVFSVAVMLIGAAPGAMAGIPRFNPDCAACQTFYGYACPVPSNTVIWLSEPAWRVDFIVNYCVNGGGQ